MATFDGAPLSGSTNGLPIPVAATSTPGTLLHTAVSGTSSFDELFLYVSNVTGGAATLTIEFGGVTDPGDLLCKAYSVAANSAPTPIAPGVRIRNGLEVRAFSGTASALNITGSYNRKQA